MKISEKLSENYVVASCYEGIHKFQSRIREGIAVIVKEKEEFIGLVTAQDLLLRPHNLIIDCMVQRPSLDSENELFPALLTMFKTNYDFLPVVHQGMFEGIVSRQELFMEFIRKAEDTDESSLILELKKELALRNRFLAIIGHDIKNMFNQVLGSLELLERKIEAIGDEKMQSVLNLAKRSAMQVNATFENMLLWARLGTGQLPFNPEKLLMKEQFEKVIGQYQLAGSVKNIRIKSLLEEDIELLADRNMLSCILLNLVYNAIKFTLQGGDILLDANQGQNHVEIIVIDTGTGISLHRKNRLFTYEQSSVGTLDEIGAGMGLIICKDFVERHGGTIEIESEEGHGTCVIVTLPQGLVLTNTNLFHTSNPN